MSLFNEYSQLETRRQFFARGKNVVGYAALASLLGNSRVWAGIHYRSDIEAGLAVSREVGKRVVARAKVDGSQ
jgi:hypothetical protein